MTTTAFLGNAKGSLWRLCQSPFLNSWSNIESPSISCHGPPFCVHCTSCDTFAHSAKADPLLPFANHCCKNWWQIVITRSPRLFKLESACSRNGNKRENEKTKQGDRALVTRRTRKVAWYVIMEKRRTQAWGRQLLIWIPSELCMCNRALAAWDRQGGGISSWEIITNYKLALILRLSFTLLHSESLCSSVSARCCLLLQDSCWETVNRRKAKALKGQASSHLGSRW